MIKREGYTVPDSTIREALAKGATHYDSRGYGFHFVALRRQFVRRYWIFGSKRQVGWERLVFFATPGVGGPLAWVLPGEWERVPIERMHTASHTHDLKEALGEGE